MEGVQEVAGWSNTSTATEWINLTSDEDSERFAERSADRIKWLQELARKHPTQKVSPITWSLLQVMDVAYLKGLFQSDKLWNALQSGVYDPCTINAFVLWLGFEHVPTIHEMVDYEGARPVVETMQPGSEPDDPRPPAPPAIGELPETFGTVDELCAECMALSRDRDRCVVTGSEDIFLTELYPSKHRLGWVSGANFWSFLRFFWPNKVETWRISLFGGSIWAKNKENNMITFSTEFGPLFNQCAFALRPVRISRDRSRMEVEFYWLVRESHGTEARMDILEEPRSSRRRIQSQGLGDGTVKTPQSGDKIMLFTDDTVNKPLPDPGILEIQWYLQRLIALSGAALWDRIDFVDFMRDVCHMYAGEDNDRYEYKVSYDRVNWTRWRKGPDQYFVNGEIVELSDDET